MPQITIVENVYHQNPTEDQDPFGISSIYEELIASDEEPYQRTYKDIGPEPITLDCGWIEECGLVHLSSSKKNKHGILVTYREVKSMFSRRKGSGFLIPPGCPIRLYPTDPKNLQISSKEKTQVTITVFPK